MPKIVITEIDETKPGVAAESTDVVYIPGFVNVDQACLYNNAGDYIGIKVNEPTLFNSVSQFESLCGTEPITFSADQNSHGFPESACPRYVPMFEQGDSDPAYIMAKELLASGLSVMYERVNPDSHYQRLDNKPSDFDVNYDDYYIFNEYNRPNWYGYKKIDSIEAPEFRGGHYYKDMTGTGATVTAIVLINEEPEDWESNYKDYYVQATTPPVSGYFKYDTNLVLNDDSVNFYKMLPANYYYTVSHMYSALEEVYDISNEFGIVDRGNFSVKYLTSGGYPSFEYSSDPETTNTLVNKMLAMAETRGDCVALIDHTDYIDRELNPNKEGSVYQAVTNATVWEGNGDFGAMFTPWATYNRVTSDTLQSGDKGKSAFRAPASFAYLTSLADSIKTNANWLAIAGVTRGKVFNIGNMTNRIPNTIADAMQPREGMSINAITNIKPYGQTIWGNRTLKKNAENLVATSFLNVRNLVSDVKKVCYRTARALTFEQDTEILWVNFKSAISPTLDRMLSGYGIIGYKIVRDTTHPMATEKATVCARIILYPTYAVEDFYITVVLKDDEVTVE